MTKPLTPELTWLVATVLLTGGLWIPYVLNRTLELGLIGALRGTRSGSRPKSAWADRLIRAHANAIENLVIFAPLVLTAHALGISTPTTVLAAQVYFFARVAHAIVYTLGIPGLRTLAFMAGVGAQVAFALAILG